MDGSGKSRCTWCGGALRRGFTQGEWRLICAGCGKISYENPTAGVAGIVLSPEEKILLVRRAKGETAEGKWCIPCGHVEYHEDIRHALVRELREETGFLVEPVRVYDVYSNFHEPQSHTVGVWFLCGILGGFCESGDDAALAGFFSLESLPPLAFETDRLVLEQLKRSCLTNV